MATRSIIKVEGMKAVIYKHWDGDPRSMTKWLTDFNTEFKEHRGDDPSYKFAQCLRFAALQADNYNLDNDKFTGWGVMDEECDCGQEYTYTLKPDGTVEVQ